ncbi:MAG TPA: hypothetical protein VK091_05380 [Virgibacillus sp.]|nr:hypothetical protein [Virgibacillus sp.]
MKYLILIASAFLLIGCSNASGKQTETPETEETKDMTETKDQVAASFRNVDIKVENEQALIEGEAKSTNDTFYYQIKQGDSVLVEETEVTLDETNLGWGKFDMELDLTDEMAEHEESPIVMLYVKGKDDTMVNPNYFPIDMTLY